MLTEIDRTTLPSYQIGHDDGKTEREREIALNLIRRIDDNEFIADTTGLELSEVQRLRAEHDQA